MWRNAEPLSEILTGVQCVISVVYIVLQKVKHGIATLSCNLSINFISHQTENN